MGIAGDGLRGGAGLVVRVFRIRKERFGFRELEKDGILAFYIVFGFGDGSVAIEGTAILKRDIEVSQRVAMRHWGEYFETF